MNLKRAFAIAALLLVSLPWASAHAGVFIGIGIPGPYYRPYHRGYYYYGPRVVVVAPRGAGRPGLRSADDGASGPASASAGNRGSATGHGSRTHDNDSAGHADASSLSRRLNCVEHHLRSGPEKTEACM